MLEFWTGPFDELQFDHPAVGESFLGELVLFVEDIAFSTVTGAEIIQPNAGGVLTKSATVIRGEIDGSQLLRDEVPIRLQFNASLLWEDTPEELRKPVQIIAYGPLYARWNEPQRGPIRLKILEFGHITQTPDGLGLSSDEAAMKPWMMAQGAFYIRIGVEPAGEA